jgi:uncharacterized membrane protein YccC
VHWLKRFAVIQRLKGWMPVWSPAAAMRAVRAAVVVAGLFAFTDKVVGNLQMATFAAFGGFATLVLSSFAGTRRDKLVAHAGLAIAGSVLLTIGTAVHSPAVLAAIATVPVTFAVFFAGVLGPNVASGATGALLAYVLPAASAGTISMIPDRLAGWWLASVAGTAAVMALSPRTGDDQLRAAASTLATSLADELDGALAGSVTDDQRAATGHHRRELFTRFNGAPFRPTGLAAPDQAFAHAVELLEWCGTLVADTINERSDLRGVATVDHALFEEAIAMLRSVSALFSGSGARPEIERLERSRERSLERLRSLAPDRVGFQEAAQISFHANSIAVAVLALGAEALVAARLATPDWLVAERRRTVLGSATAARTAQRVSNIASAAHARASLRSVWFVNSLRGSLALAASVAVADVISVQHGFWVVLGTLSVLRTNAASTGSTALRALAGTGIGFVVGGALLVAIGSDTTALWVALPIAVLVAAYAPGTAPFAVGQAAFTVTVAVLFNLLNPVGWKVGVVRIEDVALGCAVSVLAGTLLWPRGVSAVVGDDLADVFRWGASYLSQAVDWAIGARATEPDAAVAVGTAAERLDDALRGLMAEQGTKHLARHELWRLIGGSLRLRLTAWSVSGLPSETGIGAAGPILSRRTKTLAVWYEQLAELVGRPNGSRITALAAPAFAPGDTVDPTSSSKYAIWLCEYLEHLGEGSADLVEPATRIAEIRRRPWWR